MIDSAAQQDFPDLGERYEIDFLLGQGSTGRVYRARDRQLDRTVAIKVLRSDDAGELQRFQREARAQAAIDHEHVCRVFDVGEVAGRAFLAMQVVEGRDIGELAPRLEVEAKAALLEQAARAVHAGHLAGVVHRDLKPGNVMVEERSGGRLDAVVLDFGIAREWAGRAGDDPRDSTGAPAFAAPELLSGEGRANPAVDVYGLGAVLYAVLAEQAPFFGATRSEVVRRAIEENPVPLGLVVPGMPEDLETIAAVAMSKDPARRYPDAGAFADDLGRWLEGEPIRARAAGPLYLVRTWLRTRWLAAAAVTLVLVLVGGALLSTTVKRRQEAKRRTLKAELRNEAVQIDRLLRRARMMPRHDIADAEAVVRRRLETVEDGLVEHGPLAKDQAYYTLGFGHLALREFGVAERWLRAAMDSGRADAEVEAALGVAMAMQLLDRRGPSRSGDRQRIDEAVRHLAVRSPATAERDAFHGALGHFLGGRLDEALDDARSSAVTVPWLFEARQLEGDVLLARADLRRGRGDLEGALEDLAAAAQAYTEGLAVARSDRRLAEAEAECRRRLGELGEVGPALDPR